MLEKIINITPGSDYHNSTAHSGFKELLLPKTLQHIDLHDSVSFSPAWVYLSQLRWQIKNLKLLKNGNLQLNFLIDDIELHIEINVNEMDYKQSFLLLFIQNRSFNGIDKNSFITLEKWINSAEGKLESSYQFRGISILFDRVWKLNLRGELDDKECYLNTLLEEIFDDVNNETEFLLASVISFVEKLSGKNFSPRLTTAEKSNYSLILKKIKSSNA